MDANRKVVDGLLLLLASLGLSAIANAGGPKYVAGATYFDPGVLGQQVVWPGGMVNYFVDQGGLGSLSNTQATAMVDAAASVWNAVSTAAVMLTDAGSLAEDVNGSNTIAGNAAPLVLSFAAPSDVTPTATTTPVGVVFDNDGAVIDVLEGSGASTPSNCSQNGVLMWLDNFNTNATFAHAVMVLNGRCTGSAQLLAMMSYQVERAFGRILGLDFAQVNEGALTSPEPNGALAWPVMDVSNGDCGAAGGTCITNPATAHWDDVAALNRLYPVTKENISSFTGKVLTAANTVSIQGTVSFPSGQGMQGVNVVARPLDATGNPMYQYTVTFVSGSYFNGNHGNPVTGWYGADGNRLDRFGGDADAQEGFFDLSGMLLPPGVTTANYQLSFEAINPEYALGSAVGPYILGSPAPSGALPTMTVYGLSAGATQQVTVSVAGTLKRPIARPEKPVPPIIRDVLTKPLIHQDEIEGTEGQTEGTETEPWPLPSTGAWTSVLGMVGASDWFVFPVRGNRTFTVVAQALDATGLPTNTKSMPAVGVWEGFGETGTTPVAYTDAFSGSAAGEAALQLYTDSDDILRIGVVDQRGDGRPDYLYRGWVLYADSVYPQILPQGGGIINITGVGFHLGDSVYINGNLATISTISPTQITAIAPSNTKNAIGSVDVEVVDLANYDASATIPGGISYDAATGDIISLLAGPAMQVPLNTPETFSIKASQVDGTPAGGVTVQFSLTGGTAILGCGQSTCSVSTNGEGIASLSIFATSSALATVQASLNNGNSVSVSFTGEAAPQLTALTSTLFVAAGSTVQWPVQALVLNNSIPVAGQSVLWQSSADISAPGAPSISNGAGIAAAVLTASASAASLACFNGTAICVTFTAVGSPSSTASVSAISGTLQELEVGNSPGQVVIRVRDVNGNPLAAATLDVAQSLYEWAPPCPTHGRCDQAPLLATQQSVITSAVDGSASITPLVSPGNATNLRGVVTIGNTGFLEFSIVTHP
jgi:hypothetical protein